MKLDRLFVISVIITLSWMVLMGSLVKPLNSQGIVAFELAKTPNVAAAILKEWQEKDLIGNARKSIYLDFIFLLLYSISIGLGCVLLSRFTQNELLVQSGSVLSKVVPLAGLCDVVENLAMLKTLCGLVTSLPVTIAYWFAVVKFLIVAVSLLFLLICLIFGGVKMIL
jgi:hypothetical protein